MALAAAARGYEFLCLTDHSHYLRDGQDRGAVARDRGGQRAARAVPRAARRRGEHHGARAWSTCRTSVLAELDWVVASLHTSLDRSPTERVLAAIDNPHVDCIGHLTGRRISRRPGADLDLDRVVAPRGRDRHRARDQQPARPARHARRPRAARRRGGRDRSRSTPTRTRPARSPTPSSAIGQARRAWLTKEQVLNTRSWAEIEARQSVSTFREDGAAALDWVARYLEDVRELSGALAGRAGRDQGRAARLAARGRPSRSRPCSATSTRS